MSAPRVDYGPEANANAKTELASFCQWKVGKSMGKKDIIYDVKSWDGQFQATVTIPCLDGERCAGELCATEREAEKAAAHQLLLQHTEELAQMQTLKRKSRELSGRMGEAQGDGDALDPAVKGKLHTAVGQLLGREVDKPDIDYDISATSEGNVARLTLPTLGVLLPNEFSGKSWTGEATSRKVATRLSAAGRALKYIMSLPLADRLDLSQAKIGNPDAHKSAAAKKPRHAGGKGGEAAEWSSGKGDVWWADKGKGKGKGYEMMMGMMGMMFEAMKGGKGWGKAW